MFFHLQYIHLFRPFLKYSPAASPLPSHVSPRRICTSNAVAISKLIRLYKKCWNLRQICNIAVYMVHSACTIHLLNLPEKTARRDIIHGVKHLEEIAEDWLCARRTLSILSVLSRKWNCEVPEEARAVLQRTDEKYGTFSTAEVPSPSSRSSSAPSDSPPPDYTAASGVPLKTEQYPMMYDQFQGREHLMRQAATSALSAAPLTTTQPAQPPAQPLMSGQDLPPDWNNPLPTTAAMPNYRPRPAFPASGVPSSRATSRSTTRNVSPNLLGEPSVDGQNWYLSDGVRWHQNFESWGLPPSSSVGGGGAAMQAGSPVVPEFRFGRMEDGFGFDALVGSGWLSSLD